QTDALPIAAAAMKTSRCPGDVLSFPGHFLVSDTVVVLENNNGHLTQLSAEKRLLLRALLPSRQEGFVSYPWAGPGEPGSVDGQCVHPSAWRGLGRYALAAKYTRYSS